MSIAFPVNQAPWTGGVVGGISAPVGGDSGQLSAFEAAVLALGPAVHYRFRDSNFDTDINDGVGGQHLVKQIAAAVRDEDYPIRSTHPGGAYFPSVSYNDWGSLGAFYKSAATTFLNGVSAYTILVSCRVMTPATDGMKLAGVGTEETTASNSSDQLLFREAANDTTAVSRGRSGGLEGSQANETGFVQDGVNRLYIARWPIASNGSQLSTSKPGHTNLVEYNSSGTGSTISALSKAIMLNARTESAAGSDITTDWVIDQLAIWSSDIGSSAEANLHNLWAAEVSSAYYPSMMQFDGSTGYYSASVTTSGNAFSLTFRVNRDSFSGGGVERLMHAGRSGVGQIFLLTAYSSDHSTAEARNKLLFQTRNSANSANLCLLRTSVDVCDGDDHIVFYSYDGDAGTATLTVDGVDADDLSYGGRTLTAGTVGTGASTGFAIGSTIVPDQYFGGAIGCFGYGQAYRTNYADFGTGSNLVAIDEKNWTEWGAQPLLWSHTGQMDNNKGSAGNMTANGTITMTTGGAP